MSNVTQFGIDLVKSTQSIVAVITQEGKEAVVASLPYGTYEEAASHMVDLLAGLPDSRHYLIVTRKKGVLNAELPSHIAASCPYDNETANLLLAASEKAILVAADEDTKNPIPLSRAERKRRGKLTPNSVNIYTDASLSKRGTGMGVAGWVEQTACGTSPRFALLTKRGSSVTCLETEALLAAIFNNLSADVLTLHSDSKNAIEIVKTLLSKNPADSNKLAGLPITTPALKQKKLQDATAGLEIEFVWVKSHSEDRWNAVTDQMVRFARNCLQKKDADMAHVKLLAGNMLTEMINVQAA